MQSQSDFKGIVEKDAAAKFPLLISYEYLRKKSDDEIAYIVNNPNIELLLDSGAFSALNAGSEIKLDEYMKFLQQWKHKLFGYFALDKLGDPIQTETNLKIMLSEGLKPLPIHVRGDTGERMDELFGVSEWIGLGGFRRPHRGPAPKNYVMQKMLWAKGRKVHWLGYTNRTMIQTFTPYSCDCSNWASAAMWGFTVFYYGAGRWSTQYWHENIPKVIPEEMENIIKLCGFTVKEFRDAKHWKRNAKTGITYGKFVSQIILIYSYIKYIRDIRAELGTRLFLAATPNGDNIAAIFDWINRTDKGGREAYGIAKY